MNNNALGIILVAGLVTLAIRFAPFILFSRNGQIPPAIRFLGSVLPTAIMGILILLTVRHVDLFTGNRGLPEFAGIIATAGLYVWKRNTLVAIAGGTAAYMVLLRVL